MTNRAEIELLKADIRRIGEDARQTFGRLNCEQLNWKPAPERWSVAQCFDHLITTNKTYFAQFELIARGQQKKKAIQRVPVLPKLWARFLIKSLDPKTARKFKAPSPFQPSSSDIAPTIIEDFVGHQQQVLESMAATEDLNVEKIIISSPAASIVTYSLMDAYKIIVVHEERHFLQAKRVTEEPDFPN